MTISFKEKLLADYLDRFSLPAIAFSGGLDSGFLVWFVRNRLKRQAIVLCAQHELIPAREEKHRAKVMEIYGWTDAEYVRVDVLSLPQVVANNRDRCYACKKHLMGMLLDVALAKGCDGLLDGTTADEQLMYRPGVRALRELGIHSPFAETGWTKEDIRESARSYELVFASKPPESCLATRFPYYWRLELSALRVVDTIEEKLQTFTEGAVRARIHPEAKLIRIEVSLLLHEKFSDDVRREILEIARKAGFKWVTLDVSGFRSGSWDSDQNGASVGKD